MNTSIDTAYHTPRGQDLARKLACHIAKNEDFANWDECIDALVSELAGIANNLTKVPAGGFIYAEILQKSKEHLEKSRYMITLNDYSEVDHG